MAPVPSPSGRHLSNAAGRVNLAPLDPASTMEAGSCTSRYPVRWKVVESQQSVMPFHASRKRRPEHDLISHFCNSGRALAH